MGDGGGDLERFLDLQRRLAERASTRVVAFAHGTAYLDEEFPRKYDANFLNVERPGHGITAEELRAEADRILAGYEHREVVVEEPGLGARLAPTFREWGWEVQENLVMAMRREPDRPAPLPVDEVPPEDARAFVEEVNRRYGHDGETARMLAGHRERFARVVGARTFVGRVDGTIAGGCDLFVEGQDAQVESVDTLEEFRGRGVARSVVLAAVHAAREEGARRVFIVADADDWPRQLYAKLGFDEVAATWRFLSYPEMVK